MNKPADEPRSLLRRLLKKADELGPAGAPLPVSANNGDASEATQTGDETQPTRAGAELPDGETSPVRPAMPAPSAAPIEPLAPIPRTPQPSPASRSVEERLEAEAALEKLRQKTAMVAAEFAAGKLNRAQFVALYAHYNEKRVIIERLLARDPGTLAWQSVAKAGHTDFLRDHYEARALSYAIYDHNTDALVSSQGEPLLDMDLTRKILAAIRLLMRNHETLNPQRKQLENGRWVVFIPGKFTTTIVLFSLEPSARQVTMVADLHLDFERANRHALDRNIRHADQLVFPHRALFEKPS